MMEMKNTKLSPLQISTAHTFDFLAKIKVHLEYQPNYKSYDLMIETPYISEKQDENGRWVSIFHNKEEKEALAGFKAINDVLKELCDLTRRWSD